MGHALKNRTSERSFCALQEREERDGGVDAGPVRGLRSDPEAAPRPRHGHDADAPLGAALGGHGRRQAQHAQLRQAEEQGGTEGLGQEDPRLQLTKVRNYLFLVFESVLLIPEIV